MIQIENDWVERNYTLLVDGVDYDIKCYVYLRLKEVPDEYHRPATDTQVADWTLEGFDSLPKFVKPEHEQELTKQIMMRLQDEFGPN